MKKNYFLIALLLMPLSMVGQECLNAGFESGLADGYLTYTGTIDSTGNIVTDVLALDPNRFSVMHIREGIDTIAAKYCTINDSLRVVPEGGGQYAMRLGNALAGGQAEKIVLKFKVTPDLTFFLLNYAVVLNDPNHEEFEQPRFEMNILDKNGEAVDCGQYHVLAAESIEGFESCEKGWRVRAWTAVGFELQRFLGDTIQIEILTTDCSQGAHAGYAYIDANCRPLEIQLEGYCPDSTTALLRVTEGFVKYEWGADSTNTSNLLNIVNPIPESVYSVTVTSGTGCTLVLSDTIPTIEQFPTPSFEAVSSINICSGDSVLIQPTGDNLNEITNLNYNYSATSFLFNPEETTEYLFVSSDNNRCITDTLRIIVEVEQTVRSSFTTSSDTYCSGDTIELNYQSTGPSNYAFWMLGDSATYSGSTPPPMVYHSDTILEAVITLIDSANCTVDSFSKQIIILDLPHSEISGPTTVCVEEVFSLAPLEIEDLAYEWRFGDGTVVNEVNIEKAFETAGIEMILLLYTDSLGCSNTDTKLLTINPLPSAAFEITVIDDCPPAKLSLRKSAPFTANDINKWQINGQLYATDINPTPVFEEAGNFLIELITEDDKGCSNNNVENIVIPNNPSATILGSDHRACINTDIYLQSASGEIDWSYQWILSNNRTAFEQNPFFKFEEAGNVDAMLIVSNASCFDTATTTVEIHLPPEINIDITQGTLLIDQGEVVPLSLSHFLDQPIIEWQPSTGLSCNDCPMPFAKPLESTLYIVSVGLDQNCVDFDSIYIQVKQNRILYIPTSFSPNDDGINDVFFAMGDNPSIQQIKSFRVVDRWGGLLFERADFPVSDAGFGWDGTSNGTTLQQGVYVYYFEIEFIDGEIIKEWGTVSLVR